MAGSGSLAMSGSLCLEVVVNVVVLLENSSLYHRNSSFCFREVFSAVQGVVQSLSRNDSLLRKLVLHVRGMKGSRGTGLLWRRRTGSPFTVAR